MQVDDAQHATPPPALQSGSNSQEAEPAGQQQALSQSPLQMISVPEELKEFVSASVARCDRQLLGRQEQVLVSVVQQRVAEEVRSVQGAEDLDHPADHLVQKVRLPVLTCLLLLNTHHTQDALHVRVDPIRCRLHPYKALTIF